MIRILRGTRPRLHAHFAALADDHPEFLPLAPSYSYRSWNGVRHLIDGIRRRAGSEPVDGVLSEDPAAAGLVLGRSVDDVEADLARERARIAAHPESHLSHNLLVQRPFVERVARLLARLAQVDGPAPQTWLVPDLALMDRESLGALRTLLRRHPDAAPSLLVGWDPHRNPPAPDSRGLLWEHEVELIHKVVYGLLAQDDAEAVDLAPSGPAGRAPRAQDPPDNPEAVDEGAMAGLDASPDPLSRTLVSQVVTALGVAFESFAFTTVVRLGLDLLAREPELPDAQAAEIHGLVGLAAHNRQFRSAGNRVLARWLEDQFSRALAAERRPERRSALAYRLAVTRARRLDALDSGLAFADQAVAEARRTDLEPLRAAHLEAWGRNIRAYVEMRRGDDGAAIEDCKTGFELLDSRLDDRETPALDPDPWVREAAFTRSLLADNLAALFQKIGDGDRLRRWKTRADALAHEIPSLRRFEAVTWTRLYRETYRLDLALHHAREGLKAACTEQDGLRELDYRVHVADLLDRMGRSEDALAAFREARDLRRQLGDPPWFADLDLPTAAVALRAGRPDQARELLEAAWDEAGDEPASRAEIAALLGVTVARQGDGPAAEDWINRAIDAAVDSGARDVLLRVATAAGDVARHLDRPEDAREAYDRALEIADTGDPAGAEPPPAADLLAALLGRLETAPSPEPHLPSRALDLLPEALDEAQGWALVPRLAKLLEHHPEALDDARPEAREAFETAKNQRSN